MFMTEKLTEVSESQLRVAFDGDAVLFSDESERIFKAHGLDKFFEHERDNEDTLLDHVSSFHWRSVWTFSLEQKICVAMDLFYYVQYRLHYTPSQDG